MKKTIVILGLVALLLMSSFAAAGFWEDLTGKSIFSRFLGQKQVAAKLPAQSQKTVLEAASPSLMPVSLLCAEGKQCISSKCEAAKNIGENCNSAEQCKSGVCVVGKMRDTSQCQAKCTKDEECIKGKICNKEACIAPRSLARDAACDNIEACASDVCLGVMTTTGRCSICSMDANCGIGKTCRAGVCQPALRLGAPCTSPQQCSIIPRTTFTPTCAPDPANPARNVCTSNCTLDTHCLPGKICNLGSASSAHIWLCGVPRSAPDSYPCNRDEICESGHCYNGRCTACRSADVEVEAAPLSRSSTSYGSTITVLNIDCGQTISMCSKDITLLDLPEVAPGSEERAARVLVVPGPLTGPEPIATNFSRVINDVRFTLIDVYLDIATLSGPDPVCGAAFALNCRSTATVIPTRASEIRSYWRGMFPR